MDGISDTDAVAVAGPGEFQSALQFLERFEQSLYGFLTYLSGSEEYAGTLLPEVVLHLLEHRSGPLDEASSELTLFKRVIENFPAATRSIPDFPLNSEPFLRQVAKLPLEHRTIFILHDIMGFSIAKSGTVLDLAFQESVVLLRRARLMLRRMLCEDSSNKLSALINSEEEGECSTSSEIQ